MRILSATQPKEDRSFLQASAPFPAAAVPPAFEKRLADLENQIRKVRDELRVTLDEAKKNLRKEVETTLVPVQFVLEEIKSRLAASPRSTIIQEGASPQEFQALQTQLAEMTQKLQERLAAQEAAHQTMRQDIEALTDAMQVIKSASVSVPTLPPSLPDRQASPSAPAKDPPFGLMDSPPLTLPSDPQVLGNDELENSPSFLRRLWAYLNEPALGSRK